MVRQARTYFAGAVSGTALIAAAIVAFVLLVSLQTLRDWPLAGIGDSGSERESGQVVQSQARGAAGPVFAVNGVARTAAARRGAGDGSETANPDTAVAAGGETAVSAPTAEAPTGSPPSTAGGPQPGASPGGNGSGGGGSGGGSSGSGGSHGGGGGVDSPGGGAPSASETVTDTVDETVGTVDQATGGALGQTGAPQAAEEVVDGVAGPESAVGQTVDKTVEAVDGLLDGGR